MKTQDVQDLIAVLRDISESLKVLAQRQAVAQPKESQEMQAIALLLQDGPKLRMIARRLGVSHTALYGWEKFMRYYTPMKVAASTTARRPRRGFRTTNGVEVTSE